MTTTTRDPRIDAALALFAEGTSCSQAVLGAFGPELGVEHGVCLRIAAGFGGGMGRQGKMCGAVTGALMVLGLQLAAPDPDAKARVYAAVRDLCQRFTDRFDALDCTALLGCDLGTPEGWEQAVARSFHTEICPRFVEGAAEILVTLQAERAEADLCQ